MECPSEVRVLGLFARDEGESVPNLRVTCRLRLMECNEASVRFTDAALARVLQGNLQDGTLRSRGEILSGSLAAARLGKPIEDSRVADLLACRVAQRSNVLQAMRQELAGEAAEALDAGSFVGGRVR